MSQSGAAPTLLLVHGAWHGAWCWEDAFAPALRGRGFTVETMNLPGHEQAGPGRLAWHSVGDYVDAIEARLRQIGGPVIVVGHSMGGYAAQKLMERQPAGLAGVVLLAAATQRGVWGVVGHLLKTRPLEFLRASFTFNLYWLVRTPDRAKALFHAADQPDAVVVRHWERLCNESFRAFLDMLLLAPIRPGDADPALPKLVIGGGADAIFPAEITRRCADAHGAPPVIFEGMPHNLMQHARWQQVADAIAAFADSSETRAGATA